MFPGVYGFTWDAGNLIFLGVFFTVAVVIATTVTLASLRAWKDIKSRKAESIRWHEDFHDLPASLRTCRHELTGTVAHRTCPNAFDCRRCATHATLCAREQEAGAPLQSFSGFSLPADRLYHRGHTWVKTDDDGSLLVGLDDFGRRLFGRPDRMTLPAVGTVLQANGSGWWMEREGRKIRVLAPVDGQVLAVGSEEDAWVLRLKPSAEPAANTHLLNAPEAGAWMTRELEHLQIALGSPSIGPALADGGEVVEDLPRHYPGADWDAVWGEMFLEP